MIRLTAAAANAQIEQVCPAVALRRLHVWFFSPADILGLDLGSGLRADNKALLFLVHNYCFSPGGGHGFSRDAVPGGSVFQRGDGGSLTCGRLRSGHALRQTAILFVTVLAFATKSCLRGARLRAL